jgi:hypothetical protein
LTDEQGPQLAPLVRRQVLDRKGLLPVSVAPFMENGETAFQRQAQFLEWKTASKVLKLIREANTERQVGMDRDGGAESRSLDPSP